MSETTRTTTVITYAGAAAAVAAGIEKAEELGVRVCVAVVDPAGDDVAFGAMDGSPLLSRDVAKDKGWTAVAFGQPTTWWVDVLAGEPMLERLGNNNRLMAVPGGVPVLVGGDIAGGVGVSGATGEQDAEIAAAAVAAITT